MRACTVAFTAAREVLDDCPTNVNLIITLPQLARNPSINDCDIFNRFAIDVLTEASNRLFVEAL